MYPDINGVSEEDNQSWSLCFQGSAYLMPTKHTNKFKIMWTTKKIVGLPISCAVAGRVGAMLELVASPSRVCGSTLPELGGQSYESFLRGLQVGHLYHAIGDFPQSSARPSGLGDPCVMEAGEGFFSHPSACCSWLFDRILILYYFSTEAEDCWSPVRVSGSHFKNTGINELSRMATKQQ